MSVATYPTYESYKDSGGDWIGAIPQGWSVKRLKHLVRQVSDKVASKDSALRYIGMENVESWSGRLIDGNAEVEGLAAKFAENDVIFGKLRPYLAKVAKLNFSGICSTEFIIFRAERTVEPDFLAYLLRSSDFVRYVDSSTYGSKMPRVNPSFIANCFVALPPVGEQRAIVAFLGKKCAKVDEAVRIKEEQIALLRERRQILIQKAVTRGLNPDAPMKDSGIDWIGQIPAHWEVRRSKYIFMQRKELARKDDIQLSATQSYGVIPQDKFEQLVGRRVVKIQTNLEKRKHVEIDDFVISMRSFQGGLERAFATGCIRSSYVILQPLEAVNADFFGYFFKCPRYIKALQATGSFIRDGQDLNFDNFSKVDLFLPPLQEQAEIAAHIKAGCEKIDSGIAIKEEQIAALREYKTSLINAAVTGKIKVA